jgi:hypothetical protein
MKREKLVKELSEAAKTEEEVVDIYIEHFKAFTQRFNISKDDLDKLISSAGILATDSKRHKNECEDLLKYIEETKKDDY